MKERTLKVTLPGEMYERAGRWWWRVQLPGEDKPKARPLRSPGTSMAAGDRATAERIAVEMWEQAVRQTGARQITLDCAQKVERLKAQFLDKVRQLTEIVESATARAQVEAQARAEIEARLNAMMQTAGQQSAALSPQTHTPANVQPPEQTTSFDVQPDMTESVGCAVHTNNPQASGDARPTKREAAGTEGYSASTSVLTEDDIPQPQTGTCECCGAMEVPVSDLAPIDSGQLLCPECLTALHVDISRVDAEAFSDSLV